MVPTWWSMSNKAAFWLENLSKFMCSPIPFFTIVLKKIIQLID
jgi:hypothetical protein